MGSSGYTRALLAAIAASAHFVSAQKVEFFYTETLNICAIYGVSMPANEITTHGGVCAYRRDVDRVYGCPSSSNPKCWTWYQTCNENLIGQAVCNRGDNQWCCNAVAGETCPTGDNKINICISNFTSPQEGMSTDEANQVYSAAISNTSVTATKQIVQPTPFSTRQLDSTAAPTLTSTMTSGTSTSTGTPAPTENTSPSASSNSDSLSVSGGAIAGIVIGVLAVIAIVGGLFWLLRRRKNKKNGMTGTKEAPKAAAGESAAYHSSNQRTTFGGYYTGHGHDRSEIVVTPSELGSAGHGRAEMSAATDSADVRANPYRRYEMP
jgi:hypothetical protein